MLKALALLRNRNFLLTWLSSIIENIALAISVLAETWYVIDALQLKAQLGLVMIAGAVPRLALMMIGGVLADRMPKVKILKITFWLRVLIVAIAAVLFKTEAMSIWALIVFAAAFGMMDAFFWPARDALLPSIVAEHELMQANSIMQATNRIGMVVGPMVGGVLLTFMPFYGIFTLIAILLAGGAIFIGMVNERPVLRKVRKQNMLHDLKEGIDYVLTSPMLCTLLLIYIIANLLFMGPNALGPPIIASEHLHAGPKGLSYMQSAFAFGMIFGFLGMTVHPPRKKRLLLIIGVIAIEGVLLGLIGHVYTLWAVVCLEFLLGLCIACNNVPMLALIQEYTARDKLGRVMSLSSTASMGLSPVSYAMVSALLSGGISISFIMPVFGLTMSIFVLIIAVYSVTARSTN